MNYKFSLFLRCSNHSPTESRYIDCANGLWEASSGDIHVTNEIGLIAYNSYAIDTKSNIDSVRVTWDDGLSCTTTMATMHENKIELTVNDIYAINIIN